MRLLDQVSQAKAPTSFRDLDGRVGVFSGVLSVKERLQNCPVRYILDPEATEQCRDLMISAPEMFRPDDPFLRMPAERFWIEWFTDEGAESRTCGRQRMGAYIEAEPSGRRGEIELLWTAAGGPEKAPGTISFDFDHELPPPGGQRSFRLNHRDLPHLNALFRHTYFRFDAEWAEFMALWTPAQVASTRRSMAGGVWCSLPLTLAFSAMLSSGGLLDQRPTALGRLNAARARAKRPPLLDYVEVSVALGYANAGLGFGKRDGDRLAPRLHYVRGHLVRRSGKTFWRSSHLRGDVGKPLVPRTVQFCRKGEG